MGGFGLSIPAEYGGYSEGGESEYLGMVVATEELSRGSLGVGGSLITRPEILTRALLAGGTEEQKQSWLPRLATAEVMAAVAVTEPDYGSDVAGVKVTATPDRRRLADQRREDVVHVRRPGRRADAAGPHRPRPLEDPSRACRCSSCPKPRGDGHGFEFTQEPGDGGEPGRRVAGRWRAGRSTPSATAACTPTRSRSTTGSWPPRTRSASRTGSGRGFYYQMAGFENGRLQTAARAVGVMQAAYEEARQYAADRVGVRPAHRRLPAHPGQARPHGGAHPGRPPVRLRGGPA